MRTWLEAAQELATGQSERYAHECSHKTDAVLSNTREGYSLHCFKCGEHYFQAHKDRTLLELQALQTYNDRAKEVQNAEVLTLPEDFTLTIPTYYATWLYKGGVSGDVVLAMGIGWSDTLHRIILPIYSDSGDLVYWQARAVHPKQEPKYINPSVDKSTLLYRRLPNTSPSKARVVITEDILSCIRVGKHLPCCSILGTSLSDGQANRLSDYRRVSIWLDPDKAGQRGSVKCRKKLSLLTNTDIIQSDVDPKCLPDREIRRLLCLPKKDSYIYHGHLITEDAEAPQTI